MNMVTDKVIRLRMGGSAADLLEHPLIKASAGKVHSQQVTEIYHDTPDFALFRNGLRLVILRNGKRWVQRFGKMEDKRANLWQWNQTDTLFKPENLKRSAKVRKLLGKVKPAEIGPLFMLDFQRTECLLSFPDGAKVSMAEEHGTWQNDQSRSNFHELALTLVSGNPYRLYQTALTLAYYLTPGLECASPQEHGFVLLDPGLARPHLSETVSLKESMDAESAFLATNAALLRRMQGNQCAALQGVGATRTAGLAGVFNAAGQLRAMVTLYDFLLPSETRQELDEELRWLRDELRHANDWEIFITGTLERFVAHFPGYPSLGGLQQAAEARLEEAYQRMEEALSSFRFTRLALGLANWLGLQGWRDMMDQPQRRDMAKSVSSLAREALQRHHYQLRKLGKRFEELDQEGRNRLSDASDLLAYASSLFDTIFPGKDIQRYRNSLNRMRMELHPLNEVDAARRLFGEIIPDTDEAVIHLVNGWLGSREERRTLDSGSAWAAFEACSAYWH